MTRNPPSLSILGCRGIPARHGGFETFAEGLALHLSAKGWRVTVYCQTNGKRGTNENEWRGVRLIEISVRQSGPLGTVVFDLLSTLHAAREGGPVLTLGYNTSPFFLLYRLRGVANVVNMDGLEWKRAKWSWWQRAWLLCCERIAPRLAYRCVADHPAIADHLSRAGTKTRVPVIPYGCGRTGTETPEALEDLGLQTGDYAIAVARPEPENSVLEIISGWSARSRGHKLLIVGDLDSMPRRWANRLRNAASNEVVFAGSIYDPNCLDTLRRAALFHLHGHQVGGTNPSLLEAMASGSAVVAHNNEFNRQVVGDGALYFNNAADCDKSITALLGDQEMRISMGQANHEVARECFSDQACFEAWRSLLARALG